MFSLFKKNIRVCTEPERETFSTILKQMGPDYHAYLEQLDSIKKIRLNVSSPFIFYEFQYPIDFFERYENRKITNFRLEDIKIFDTISNDYIAITLYFADQMFLSYSTDISLKKILFNPSKIDLSQCKIKEWGDEVSKTILSFLNKEERAFINSSSIYITRLEGKDYYHLKELEDGDFIGIDDTGQLYEITHAPFEITQLKRDQLLSRLRI